MQRIKRSVVVAGLAENHQVCWRAAIPGSRRGHVFFQIRLANFLHLTRQEARDEKVTLSWFAVGRKHRIRGTCFDRDQLRRTLWILPSSAAASGLRSGSGAELRLG